MYKKIVSLLVASLLLTGCGSSDGSSSKEEKAEETSEETTEVEEETTEEQKEEKKEYKVGETWVVDGQWEFTITSVEKTDERNEYADTDPEAVYLINYEYKNTGYEDESGFMEGLYLSLDLASFIDSDGKMAQTYPLGSVEKYAQETPVDAYCEAQAAIGVEHAGPFKINIDTYDSDSNRQKATFVIEVE